MDYATLKNSMASLVNILRELLANMEEEQQAILVQNEHAFEVIMNKRSSLISSMHISQKTMVEEIDQLKIANLQLVETETEQDKLLNLAQLIGEDNVEILTLRDQILALTQKMERQNISNHVLLGNKTPENNGEQEKYSHHYKPSRRRIHPKKISPLPKKPLVKTLEATLESDRG